MKSLRQHVRPSYWLVFLLYLSLYTLLIPGYIGSRFAWRWLDVDAARLTVSSASTLAEGTLNSSEAYNHGFAYSVLNTLVVQVAGIELEVLQSFVQPFLVVLLVPVSFLVFRSLSGSAKVAALASLLFFMQPEFLFESLRGSHAKFTYLLALTMIFVLARSFTVSSRGLILVKWVVCFYLLAFALITSNTFFASSYIFGFMVCFLISWGLIQRWDLQQLHRSQIQRFFLITTACLILVFLVIFSLYPPALQILLGLDRMVDRVGAFLLDVEEAANPYGYVGRTWLNIQTYLAVTLYNWVVLGMSLIAWVLKANSLYRKEKLSPASLLLWLLYTGFGTMLALAILLDFTGVLSANMQVRLFPHLMVFAIPLASELVVRGIKKLGWRNRWLSVVVLVVSVSFFAFASMLKVTNEPLLSTQGSYYSATERSAIEWASPHLAGPWVWLGFNPRLYGVMLAYGGWQETGLEEYFGLSFPDNYDLLRSELMDIQAARLSVPLPDVRSHFRVYDNGDAEIYHSRPQTTYQR